MEMEMRHRLPSRHAAGVKQIDARCTQDYLVMECHLLNDAQSTGQYFRWHAEQVGMVGFRCDHGMAEGFDLKRKKADNVFVFINHPRA